MERAESIRLHLDWWGKCRTCAHWRSQSRLTPWPMYNRGVCLNPQSPFGDGIQETHSDGYCKKWDTFDEDVAFALMTIWERGVETARMDLGELEWMVSAEIDFIPPS